MADEEPEELVKIEEGHDPNRPIMEAAKKAAMEVIELAGYTKVTLALSAVVTPPTKPDEQHAILAVGHGEGVGDDANMRALNLLIQNFRELAQTLGMDIDILALDKPFGGQG